MTPQSPTSVRTGTTLAEADAAAKGLLFDLSGIDLSQRLMSRQDLERINPHRGDMALLDWIVWHSEDLSRAVALKHTRSDEFWVKGHFPGKPMFPGVLMIESAAQLAVFLYNKAQPGPLLAAFTRIERAVFRSPVAPGDEFYVLCDVIKRSRRGFTCDVQGVVNGQRIAFESQISGLAIGAAGE